MKSVLIVEDDLMLADIMEAGLTIAGFEVCGIARTVDEALVIGEMFRPDLAVIDVRLVGEQTGAEAGGRLRQAGRIGVLFASANIDYVRLSTAEGDACLRKPFVISELSQCLNIIDQIVRYGHSDLRFPSGFHLLNPEGTMLEPEPLVRDHQS